MKHRRTARRAVLAGLAVVSLAAAANARPTVLWHSSKAVPDQTVMLFGDRLGEDTRVVAWHAPDEAPDTPVETPRLPGNGTRLEVRGRSRSDCLMVGLPDDFGPGVYALQVTSAGGASGLVYLNRPQATWWLGDQPEGVSPGASIRLFGQHLLLTLVGETPRRSDALPDGHMGKAVLTDAKGTVHNLTLENVDKYTLTARLPASAAVGSATVHVHNGHGGRWGWSEALPVEVRVAEPWPTTRYNVRELGAAGDGQADDTESLRAALRRAERNGGGIVTIPRGTYKITGSLTVPARTVVRGEGRDTTRLYVPKETPEFNAVFAGDADFAIEHLWLTAQTPRRLIAAPDQEPLYRMPIGHPPAEFWTRRHVNPRGPARNVRLFDLRLHHLRYAHRVGSADKDPRRPESSGPSTVITYGPYVDIQKCEIVSSGMPVRAMDAYRSRIMDNVLHTGRNGWYSLSRCRETCFEGNRIVGHDLEASYGGYNGKQIAQVYIADNTFGGGFGGERESLTFDAPGAYLWQSVEIVKTATAGEVVVRPSEGKTWERYSLAGLGCLVIKGTGLGQMRQIVSHTADTLVLDRPWDVVPEPGSAVALWPYRTQVVVYRNRSEDTSVGVQLWAGGHDFVVDSNTSVRTSGMYGTATHFVFQGMQQFLHCFFTQWLNNTIDQGYIYQQGPFDYATLGLINRLSDRGPAPEATPILANVIRGNAVSDGARIGLFHYGANYTRPIVGAALSGLSPFAEPPGRATLIEGNTVTHASVGIEVQAFFEDTLVRDNACSEVEIPVKDVPRILADAKGTLAARRRELQGRDGPILWYRFEALKPDGVVRNEIGDDFHARVVGRVSLGVGRSGKAMRLDGHSYLQVGHIDDVADLALLNLPRCTLTCWVKPDDVEGRYGLVVKRLNAAGSPYVLCIQENGLTFNASDPQGQWPFNTTVADCLEAKQWQHVTVTLDEQKGIEFYVDGKRRGGRSFSGALCRNAAPLVIGREVWGGNPPRRDAPGMYRGLIDEVKIWGRVLNADEIRAESQLLK